MNRAPLASIVLPAYYSQHTIAACLSALKAQSVRDFEVIVVNSSPDTETGRIVATEFPDVVFYQSPTRLLPHAARNAGVAFARGEVIVFTDPDCSPDPRWLEMLMAAHAEGWSVVQGAVDLRPSGWLERGIHVCKRFSLFKELRPYSPWIVSSINVSYSRAAWEAAGPFDGTLFSGDALLGWRAAAKGFRARFTPRAIVYDRHAQTIRGLAKERYTRGQDFARLRADYEAWPRWRRVAAACAAPAALLVVLAQAARASWAAGHFVNYLATLPIQIVGQAGWILGESRHYLTRIPAEAPRLSFDRDIA